jgi:hypothetical protein
MRPALPMPSSPCAGSRGTAVNLQAGRRASCRRNRVRHSLNTLRSVRADAPAVRGPPAVDAAPAAAGQTGRAAPRRGGQAQGRRMQLPCAGAPPRTARARRARAHACAMPCRVPSGGASLAEANPPSLQRTGSASGAPAAGGAAAPLGRQASPQLARPPAPGRCSWSPTGRAWSARGGHWRPRATWRCPRAARARCSWWTRAGAGRGRSLGPVAPALLRMCSRPQGRPGR